MLCLFPLTKMQSRKSFSQISFCHHWEETNLTQGWFVSSQKHKCLLWPSETYMSNDLCGGRGPHAQFSRRKPSYLEKQSRTEIHKAWVPFFTLEGSVPSGKTPQFSKLSLNSIYTLNSFKQAVVLYSLCIVLVWMIASARLLAVYFKWQLERECVFQFYFLF